MSKLNPEEFGSSGSQKLRQEDLKGDFAIVTIASVEARMAPDERASGGERKVLILRFKETRDKTLWINWPSELRMLMAQLGDDDDAWVGKQVPVVPVTRLYEGKQFPKVVIADPAKWGELFKQAAIEWKRSA